ncbi:hypothetical protein Q4Q35_13125 [Flavivirga aquimarina]|uniref:TPM domain-containing protein n=1 Tax=Flavivirga aquimarina TaxID=2027862 RepID=A0ABT8WC68_9FLAO|nr:hypothetical protein [Flavivirga aquimarina]MDO5970753.1 hypothetical protein [Flavivirga aquimarina]
MRINHVIIVSLCIISLSCITKLNTDINQDLVKDNNVFSNKALELTITNMLNHNKNLLTKVNNLCIQEEKLFFFYSKDECTTCIDNALTDIYELAKKANDSKIIIITPGLDEKQNNLLFRRYDGYLIFISGTQNIWDKYALEIKNNLALFFTMTPKMNISSSYVFKMHKKNENKSFFEYIKKRFND